ncbi:MAG: putative selenate reductase subunit YgfK [Chloroflexota bacterium]|nr:putative selenate reductase subunit YgfK [Chloroflexota bacterium]
MSDVMYPIEFKPLLDWIIKEYKNEKSIFSIPEEKFYYKPDDTYFIIFGEKCETPVGPAAGPHTQVAQNIVAAYLTGSRFFELKTVQILDELEIEKPCIDVPDEGYNTEWSTELKVQEAFEEYVKAWFLIYVAEKMLGLSQSNQRGFVFNMSVGYDLEGIKSPKIDQFIEGLRDASDTAIFQQCAANLKQAIRAGDVPNLVDADFVDEISPHISNSITLSTMHGCPPDEQESICKYLIAEKKMHTFVKLNPTLHGYEYVKDVFTRLGYDHITLEEDTFSHDMQYPDAVKMLRNLRNFARVHGVTFGVKLSNTLAVVNDKGALPTDEMYMSGRALYPLTINLARKLSEEFDGQLPISYSGGANYINITKIFETGIRPITMATELLKPGGYSRMKQLAELLEEQMKSLPPESISLEKLRLVADDALTNVRYRREAKPDAPMKIDRKLGLLDCFVAPCMIGCPINQDIPEYIRLIGEERYFEAYQLIVSKNPLPFMTGFICEHGCELKCVRNDYEDAVLIRDLKRIAAERGFDEYLETLADGKPENGIKVAVVGAGPAGLSLAYFLAREGFDVTVFDKADQPGGMVAHGIPAFRIPDWAIENDLALIEKMGIDFELGCDPEINVDKLKAAGFEYIYMAIGAWKSRMLKVEGDQDKVVGAIKFLQEFKHNQQSLRLGKNVAVIGGGNSAMDSARAAKRVAGVENVYILYRRTNKEMPAESEELNLALEDGVIFRELLNPNTLENGILTCQQMKLGERGASGRPRPVPVEGEFVEFEIDSVLSAIGELVDYDLLKANRIAVDDGGKIVVDDFNETSVENVYIGGDAYRGPASIVEAIADAQKTADGILSKEGITAQIVTAEDYQFDHDLRLQENTDRKAIVRPKVPADQFDTNFAAETNRCLECNLVCNKCVEVCPNRANVAIKMDTPRLRDVNQILHLDGLCNECGNCAVFCPYDSAPYQDKFTLFWNLEDFEASNNQGFVYVTESKLKMRYAGNIYDLILEADQVVVEDSALVFNDEMQNLLEMVLTVAQRYPYLLIRDQQAVGEVKIGP